MFYLYRYFKYSNIITIFTLCSMSMKYFLFYLVKYSFYYKIINNIIRFKKELLFIQYYVILNKNVLFRSVTIVCTNFSVQNTGPIGYTIQIIFLLFKTMQITVLLFCEKTYNKLLFL